MATLQQPKPGGDVEEGLRRGSRARSGAILVAAWLLLVTTAGLVTELGRIQTSFRDWPHRIAVLLGLAKDI